MTWTDAVIETPSDVTNVRETRLDPGTRVHVDWAVVTNNGPHPMDVAVWINPRQPEVRVWDPTGRDKASIQVMFTGDDMHAERGVLSVDRLTQPG